MNVSVYRGKSAEPDNATANIAHNGAKTMTGSPR